MTAEVAIRDAERRRCAALLSGDVAMLSALLSDDLVHVHGHGGIDDKQGYLRSIEQKYLFHALKRGDLSIRVYGDVAVVVGKLHQILSARGSEVRHEIDGVATQTWVRRNGAWLQNSCHNSFITTR